MMHFPLFQISTLFPKIFQPPWKIFTISSFPKNIFQFSYAKISDDRFLVIDSEFRISPLFWENYYSSYFFKFFVRFTCFYILFLFFVSPYVDHDAFMHHTMHVLDAPEPTLAY